MEKIEKLNTQESEECFVNFGDEWRKRIGSVVQRGARYIHGQIEGWSNLGEGLKFYGDPINNYHAVKIHKDDIEEFFRRFDEYQKKLLNPKKLNEK